ncbi:amino acid permease [Halobacteria archaeon HArc-gm2]|nr:amino acid permease [Halobacteria archaeon HArc-gm2]
MPKELERDLGLFAVIAISIGAMVGSGIFILPGLALETAGPAVILAYLLAGVLVLPAALSKSEMATAMPQAGGTYIYIERGMGPLLGTIAGVGTWFSLSFKGALALVGGVPYMLYLFDLPQKPVALGLAAVLIVVNMLGAKQTGRLQIGIVAVMLAALLWFVLGGLPDTTPAYYGGFFDEGSGGLLAATGLVFVSYAGVTKIASVAEEVENPDRNIPLGILGSLTFTTLLYVLIVVVMVGVTTPDLLSDSDVPMIHAAEASLAPVGVFAIIAAAVLALVSTANAGILSSSRYPFAMARDDLAPPSLTEIHDKYGTPVRAITLTGAVMLVLIAFVPIAEIAKLASAFQIVVFALVNGAVIAFREGAVGDYDPSFESPLYPWTQIVGILGGLLLIGFMGTIPLVGALVITVGSVLWYFFYAREKVDREGAATDVVRRSVGRKAVERTKSAFDDVTGYEVLVAITEHTSEERERSLLRIAADVARKNDGSVTVVQFDEVPDQVTLEHASETQSPADVKFERQTEELTAEFDVPIRYGEIVSHDAERAIVNFADHEDPDFLLLTRRDDPLYASVFGTGIEWITSNAPCDVLLVEDRDLDRIHTITVVTDNGPFDPERIAVASALATETGSRIDLLYPIEGTATDAQRETITEYLAELEELCSVPVHREIVDSEDPSRDIVSAIDPADLLIIGTDGGRITGNLFGRPADRIVDAVDCTAIQVHPQGAKRSTILRRLFERFVF